MVKNEKIEIKKLWIKPEIKELDVNKTATTFSGSIFDGSFTS